MCLKNCSHFLKDKRLVLYIDESQAICRPERWSNRICGSSTQQNTSEMLQNTNSDEIDQPINQLQYEPFTISTPGRFVNRRRYLSGSRKLIASSATASSV